MERKTKGRQKITMAKMENESNLQVTFSKRRAGLFKKASELSILCGAEVGVIVFSPGNKAFSFGHPGVDSIIDRFLTRNPPPNSNTDQLIEARRNASVRQLNLQLTHVQKMLEVEKQRGEALDRMRAKSQSEHWWEAPIEQQSLQQLEQLKAAMEELRSNVATQVDKLMQEHSTNSFPFLAGPSSCGSGGGSGVLPFPTVPNSFGGGARGSGVSPFFAGPSSFGGVGGGSISNVSPFSAGPSSFGVGGVGGSGQFSMGPNSFGGGIRGDGGTGVFPSSAGPNSFGGGGGSASNGGGASIWQSYSSRFGGSGSSDGGASESHGAIVPCGFNHGYGRGFF